MWSPQHAARPQHKVPNPPAQVKQLIKDSNNWKSGLCVFITIVVLVLVLVLFTKLARLFL
jgi:hypothetical protein